MNSAFVTYLGTDSFLPGVLALHQSLITHNHSHDLLVLATWNISSESIDLLNTKKISFIVVDDISNPHQLGADERGFKHTFTKLRVFELEEYQKIVYLDSDMLVCGNIDTLFDAPHMSAVAAGGLLPENRLWTDMNTGLMVIEPSLMLAEKMRNATGWLPSGDGSDQGFLHSFYPDWPRQKELHLGHQYNAPLVYLDSYCNGAHGLYFSYLKRKLQTNIAVIHYWGAIKPWHFNIKTFSRRDQSLEVQAMVLWWDTFARSLDNI
ncbi:MAG: glycosyltransferase [Mucilaginibacter sp.]